MTSPLTFIRPGQTMIIAIIFLAVVLILIASMFSRVSNFLQLGAKSVGSEQARNLAEAGVEKALWQLNETAGAYTGEANAQIGTTGTFTTTIENKNANLKTITATGFIPNSTSPRFKQVIKVDTLISAEQISFNYAVQVGTGGVTMQNSATINGTVYSNKTGVGIQGYNSAQINGDAYAVGTISSPDPLVVGTKYQSQPASEMPSVDYQQWRDLAAAGGTTSCSCTLDQGVTNAGPRKYQGDLTIQNGATLNMQGPIWISGNLTVQNSQTKVNLDQSFGSNGTVMIVDGTVTVQNAASFNPTSANPKGHILVVTTSTSANALSISNQGVNAVFYALEGTALLQNSANATALVAKTLNMQNSATLTYDQGLSGGQFSGGPGGSWQVKKGTFKYK